MIYKIITVLVILIILCVLYKAMMQNKENFSIVYPFYNEYHPYTNPFSECIEDVYGDMRCYDPVYNFRYLPYYYKYPRRYRNIYRRYKRVLYK